LTTLYLEFSIISLIITYIKLPKNNPSNQFAHRDHFRSYLPGCKILSHSLQSAKIARLLMQGTAQLYRNSLERVLYTNL
jgi:hypothetical protein